MNLQPPILEIQGLSVSYDGSVPALDSLDFSVAGREIFGIIGESGAGKTTLCAALTGRLPQDARCLGQAQFSGVDLTGLSPRGFARLYTRRIALVPQGTGSLNPLVTVGSHLNETLRVAWPKAGRSEIRDRALDLLNCFGLPPTPATMNRFPFQMSGGMNQRVLLCLAFAGTPDLVICDEPTKSLDPDLKKRVMDFLARVPARLGTTQIMVTHDLDAARTLCRNLVVLHRGCMVETGPAGRLLDSPGHPYTRALVRALPEKGMIPLPDPHPGRTPSRGACSFSPWCAHVPACTGRPKAPADLGSGQKVWCSRA